MYSSVAQRLRSRGPARIGQIEQHYQVYDFASFIMIFNEVFVRDKHYSNFGMANSLPISNEIGRGSQFSVRLLRLPDYMPVRTSDDPSSRLTAGAEIVLKWPNLEIADNLDEQNVIKSITTELLVISHPGLREHPRILDVYGFAWDKQVISSGESVLPVIMVEYGEYGTLTQFLGRRQKVDLDTKLMLASDIAHAVHALHQNGIAHSDLKPENILVVHHDTELRPVAKLGDFGLSIFLDQHDSTKPWTAGTRPWMAPEHMTPVTTDQLIKADIYSCGLILWSIILDGLPPWKLEAFENDSLRELFELVKKNNKMLIYLEAFENHSPEELLEFFKKDILQRQILLAFVNISGRSEGEAAEAHHAAAIMNLLRIGTVAPSAPGSAEYTGYHIDAAEVLKLLESAANENTISKGSPSSQAIYHRVSKALETPHARDSNVLTTIQNVPKSNTISRHTTIQWLKRATMMGSHVASSTLRELDPNAWREALSIFRTEYCGVGHKLLENSVYKAEITTHSLFSDRSSIPEFETIQESGDTPLHIAATVGRLDIIQHLVQDGPCALINTQNIRGETALLQATRSGNYAIVEYLIAAGASGNILTDNFESPLHWLCAFEDRDEDELFQLALALCHSGADIDGVCAPNTVFNEHFRETVGGGTPLCRAVQRDSYIAAKVLINLGADPYKDRGVGDHSRAPHAAALACCAHNSRMLLLLLASDIPIQPPKWYGKAGLFDPQYTGEAFKAYMTGESTIQSAAPNVWKSMTERGAQSSLLGYAVNPDPLHYRMALHGESYLQQMQLTIDILASAKSQEFERVTFDYASAIKHSILSRDISIVSHLLAAYPEQTVPELINPVPSGMHLRLPAQLALAFGDRPIFDLLLSYAGPDTQVSPTKMQGMTDNWLSQGLLWLLRPTSTIASEKVNRTTKSAIHLAAYAHPDPHFMNALLSNLSSSDARTLVNSHGKLLDEVPLSIALQNQHFNVADVLLRYGANIEEEASNIGHKPGQSTTPLGTVITFNNSGTMGAVEWLLRHGASNIVNKEYGITALMTAVRAGTMYDISRTGALVPTRLYDLELPVLERLLQHFCTPRDIDHKADGVGGTTALHWGVLRLCPEAVSLLLRSGADKSLTAEFARPATAKELAEALDEEAIPSEAKERGPDEIERYLERFNLLQQIFALEDAGI
ncbi:serine threonine kinase [Fusarium tjaetaba]|uniref:Serine threonine kinase n=1 Tax=Fusarium tjaetaba TaxID=1567544 RepID=A0A8H5RV41_9HYPO|nr:serine threonine kinase [Fusarium tjaetaba]KAF5638977.1 serine threonine kinase [Fusarium tjaetaba]